MVESPSADDPGGRNEPPMGPDDEPDEEDESEDVD
jgi:hypothetical protein